LPAVESVIFGGLPAVESEVVRGLLLIECGQPIFTRTIATKRNAAIRSLKFDVFIPEVL